MVIRHAIAITATAAVVLMGSGPAEAQGTLRAEGTAFVLDLGDGTTLRGPELTQATFSFEAAGGEVAITIDSVSRDRDAVGGEVLLHHFTYVDEKGQAGELCAPDADGNSLGFPVPDGHGGFDLTCTSGAEGKCVLQGYRPWEQGTGGVEMAAMHRACVNMTRADYAANGETVARESPLRFCDRLNIHPCEGDSRLAFEAAWGADGALCVARPRNPDLSLADIEDRIPWLAGHLGADACSESRGFDDGRALFLSWVGR